MTRPIKASEQGLKPHYRVRVVLPGVILHLASWSPRPGDERFGWGVSIVSVGRRCSAPSAAAPRGLPVLAQAGQAREGFLAAPVRRIAASLS
jgi:hypothetical protein